MFRLFCPPARPKEFASESGYLHTGRLCSVFAVDNAGDHTS